MSCLSRHARQEGSTVPAQPGSTALRQHRTTAGMDGAAERDLP